MFWSTAVVVLSVAGNKDTPIQKNWPRPRLKIYMMVLTTIFVWLVPWLTDTVSVFWTRLIPVSNDRIGLSLLRAQVAATQNSTATMVSSSPSSSVTLANELYSSSSSIFLNGQVGGFDLGFLVNLIWSIVVVLLSLWVRYFVSSMLFCVVGRTLFFVVGLLDVVVVA